MIVKTLVRFAVIGTLVGGAAAVIAGPERLHAVVGQARSAVQSSIDAQIDDPAALRSQLERLQAQYPGKIAEVRRDLAELQRQRQAVEREQAVGERVVALATSDLEAVSDLIARAEDARADSAGAVVRVRFENRTLNMDDAYAKANSIRALRDSYQTRQADLARDVTLLGQQEQRLGELLTQLETEQGQFQAQLYQLDRQVDAIARNERMIDLLEKRERTLAKHDRYSAHSLDQVQGQIAGVLADQEARLAQLAESTTERDYAEQAEYELDAMLRLNSGASARPSSIEIQPRTIEIGPADCDAKTEHAPIASRR